jgi:hypothetical protein
LTRTLSSPNLAALQARNLVARDFLWIVARDRSTNADVPDGMWSDVGPITASIIDPDSGSPVSRSWTGTGTLIQISDVPLVSNITIQNVTMTLSQVSDHVNSLVRTYDCKQARVEVYRGLFDPVTRVMVDPATPRFVGYVDNIEIVTPTEGANGSVIFTCASHTQEMTRSNSDTRSDASQRVRSSTDDFFNDVTVVGSWQFFWGKSTGAITPAPTFQHRNFFQQYL